MLAPSWVRGPMIPWNPPEQKLPVEIGHVNCVHVDHIDAAKAAEGQILQQLTAQTAGPHHQHAAGRNAVDRPGSRASAAGFDPEAAETAGRCRAVKAEASWQRSCCYHRMWALIGLRQASLSAALRSIAHRQSLCRNSLISGPGSNPGPTTFPCRFRR